LHDALRTLAVLADAVYVALQAGEEVDMPVYISLGLVMGF
jgi:hypothetical protein